MDTARITVGDVYSEVTFAPPRAWALIRETCKARPENYMFMPAYKKRNWDGYISLMRGWKTFPTGLLSHVTETLNTENVAVSLTYASVKAQKYPMQVLPVAENVIDGVVLRDYQVGAVQAMLENGRGIAKMATNAGKTVVYAAVVKLLGNRDTLIVVQSLDLLYQTSKRMAEYLGRAVGIIGDSKWDTDDICVATIQTLNAQYKRDKKYFTDTFSSNNVLVVDECQHISGDKTFDILMTIPGFHRYGVSGTPLDRGILNDLKLVACTGPMVVEVTNDELITAGWSATPIVHFHDVPHPRFDLWESSYPEAVDRGLVHHDKRNEKIIEVVGEGILEGRSSLVIVNRIEHGEILEKLAVECSIPTLFVQGKSDMEKRFEALDWLRKGKVCAVIATPIFDEGVDVPALDSVVLACGGASHVKLLQRVGRGLRKKEGRNIMHVHDFTDSCNKFLSKHAQRRRDVYEKEGFAIQEE